MPSRSKSENNGALRRGSACLSCRRRKLKCDGLRPVCQQCSKMRRSEDCHYDDSRKKSRTQMLKEKLAMLEDKVRELESEASGSGREQSHSPAAARPSPSVADGSDPDACLLSLPPQPLDITSWVDASNVASSSYSSPTLTGNMWSEMPPHTSPSLKLQPTLSEHGSTRYNSPSNLLDTSSLVDNNNFDDVSSFAPPLSPYDSYPDWSPTQPLPYETHNFLLGTFMAHRNQCCFYSDMSRFGKSTFHQQGDLPHPALMNAVYLLACHFARSPLCAQLEEVFLSQTLQEITTSLHNSGQLVDVIQASTLLAVYYYFNGRILEGYRHSFSAARLAVGLGLHQIRVPKESGYSVEELKNRISAFWHVFMVDRCWTAANGLLSGLPDETTHCLKITTPLPTKFDDSNPETFTPGSAIFALFEAHPAGLQISSLSTPAYKAMAAALYDRTSRLVNPTQKDASYWTDHSSCMRALQRLQSVIPPYAGREEWRIHAPSMDVDMLAAHTMINVAIINLQQDDDPTMKTSWAINSIIELIRTISHEDYQYLDPSLSICWYGAGQTLSRRLKIMGANPNNMKVVMFMKHCIGVLAHSLEGTKNFIKLTGDLGKPVEQAYLSGIQHNSAGSI